MSDAPHDPNPYQSPDPNAPPVREPKPTGDAGKDDRQMAMLAHLLGALLGFIGPLIIWIIKKDDSQFVDDQGKEALNFQLTILIGYVVSSVLMCVYIGALLFPLIWLTSLIFGIIGAMKANEGEYYRYPVTIRMIS